MVARGHAYPRDHHRPGFDTAESIQALLHLGGFDDVFVGVFARLIALARDLDGPRLCFKVLCVLGGVALVGSKLVEVVITRYVFVLGRLQVRAVQGVACCIQLGPGGERRRRPN